MISFYSAISSLVNAAGSWVSSFMRLFFTYRTTADQVSVISGLSFIGLFCLAIPLVGLGIGVIRRLVKIRA